VQEGRKKLLDLLLEWGVQRPAQLEQHADDMQRTGQALDARFKVCNLHIFPFSISTTAIHNNNHNQHKLTVIMIVLVIPVITVVTHHNSNNNNNSNKLNALRLVLM